MIHPTNKQQQVCRLYSYDVAGPRDPRDQPCLLSHVRPTAAPPPSPLHTHAGQPCLLSYDLLPPHLVTMRSSYHSHHVGFVHLKLFPQHPYKVRVSLPGRGGGGGGGGEGGQASKMCTLSPSARFITLHFSSLLRSLLFSSERSWMVEVKLILLDYDYTLQVAIFTSSH